MKYALIGLVFAASSVQADSLCGVMDKEQVVNTLAGNWTSVAKVSVETETVSVVEPLESFVIIGPDGELAFDLTLPLGRAALLDVATDPYDVDHVDDILDTVEGEWIADDVSMTPCGPDDLLQLSAPLDMAPSMTGSATIVPYFSDKIVLIAEVESRGEWGLAFITMAAILTPDRDQSLDGSE